MPAKLLILTLLPLAACSLLGPSKHPPLDTVAHVDLTRYMGRWHEIARLPASFQEGCEGSTADYRLRDDGKVEVINRCLKDGKQKEAKGVAKVVDPSTNSKLRVSFFRPFWGDYWIIELDPEYRWVVVGTPDRKYLWILAREPQLNEAILEGIVDRAIAKSFDTTRLIRGSGQAP